MQNTRSANPPPQRRTSGTLRRRSSVSQPTHRLAPWARHRTSYNIYTSYPSQQERVTSDFGVENFSYDPAHLVGWQITPGLEDHLTPELSDIVRNIMLGGAAVDTSFERIENLTKGAVHRIAPRSSHAHLLSPRTSNSPTSIGAEAEGINSPLSLTPASLSPVPNFPVGKPTRMMPRVPQLPVNMIGLESPPFTPFDTNLGNTPLCEPQVAPIGTPANLDVVSAQLSPMDNAEVARPYVKNDIAFENFINCMREEVVDLKYSCLSRLRSYIITFRTVCIEQTRCDMTLVPGLEHHLMKWWTEINNKVERLRQTARDLEHNMANTAAALRDAGEGAAASSAA